MTEEYEKMLERAKKEALLKYEKDLLKFKKTADGLLQIAAYLIQNYNIAEKKFDDKLPLKEEFNHILGDPSSYSVDSTDTNDTMTGVLRVYYRSKDDYTPGLFPDARHYSHPV